MVRAAFVVIAAITFQVTVARASDTWRVDVRETAGIQRYKYPVSADFRAGGTTSQDNVSQGSGFELRGPQGPIEAQFTRHADAGNKTEALWSVDFHVDLSPLETRTFSIHRRKPGAKPPPRRRGLSVVRAEGNIHIRHPSLEFVIAEDLSGLFQAIDVAGDPWIVAGADGLVMQLRDGRRVPLVLKSGGQHLEKARVVKSGPLAVRVEFAGGPTPSDGDTTWTVVCDFPLGKSWVRVDCQLADPSDAVASLAARFRLRLEPDDRQPILADVGANGWTYAALRAGETLAYLAGEPPMPSPITWRVDRVTANAKTPFVLPGRAGNSPPPEGWAHLMDPKRCTAIAIDRFADATRDAIELSADGWVRLQRDFPTDSAAAGRSKPKRFTFWLHVVYSPPQVGAATSPQSMQTPPEVRVLPVVSRSAAE